MPAGLTSGCQLAALLLLCSICVASSSSSTLAPALGQSLQPTEQKQQQQQQQQQQQKQQQKEPYCEEPTAVGLGIACPPSSSRPISAATASVAAAAAAADLKQQQLILIAANVPMGRDRVFGSHGGPRQERLQPYMRSLKKLNERRQRAAAARSSSSSSAASQQQQQQSTHTDLSLADAARILKAALGDTVDQPLTFSFLRRLLNAINVPIAAAPSQQQQQQQKGEERLALPQVLRLLQVAAGAQTITSAALDGLLAAEAVSFVLGEEAATGAAAAAAAAELEARLETLAAEYIDAATRFYAEGTPYLLALHSSSKPVRDKMLLQLKHLQQQQQQPLPKQQQLDVLQSANSIQARATVLVAQKLPQFVAAALKESSSSSSNYELHIEVLEGLLVSVLLHTEAAYMFAAADADAGGSLDSAEFLCLLLLQQLHLQQLLHVAAAAATAANLRTTAAVLDTPWTGELGAGWLEAAPLLQKVLPSVSFCLFAAADADSSSSLSYDELYEFLNQQDLLVAAATQTLSGKGAVLYL
ncbi:hypothetical protein, conserved [Eimeria tenella]|uniref:EF-hand domain-containing protein n=1 Tax=Eimeria tenella TaxID=5802 RepID=U6L275_EIMTE|nr:hypothetical protein, conserved [Eimeria tenella]CDJ42704.1 hypothetical protein, conserved [Eimeria tenella]|eukprot:XP_013233454.1 hypothetical protein, conserved [Eimeria tenella]